MSPVKMVVYWSFASWVGFMGGAVVLLGGCTASTNNDDLFQFGGPTPDPSPDPPPQTCASIYTPCSAGETGYASESACRREHTSCRRLNQPACAGPQYCGKTEVQCEAVPSCDPDDEEVATCPKGASCYTRTMCGSTILCQRPFATCTALPTCDAGDEPVVEIDTCKKPGVTCYSRTTCGTTIWCVDR